MKISNDPKKFLNDLIEKCHTTSNHAVTFSSTRLMGHARLFPTKIAMRTVELSCGILTALDRLDRLELDDAKYQSIHPETSDESFKTQSQARHAALVEAFEALDLVDRFINVFRPVTRLEYFAEEKILEDGWMNAINKIENAKQSLTNILLSKREQTLINGASSWDVIEAEDESNGNGLSGRSNSRMAQCFQSLEEATKHVWGGLLYETTIEYDVERKRNKKIKTLLDDIRKISAADKKADTSQSIEQMLDATSVFDGFVRQFSLGSIIDKLAKKTKSSRNEIGETIKGHWETLGFDMDDDRAFEMIELFLITNNKTNDNDDDGPSLDSTTRLKIYINASYLGSIEDVPNVVRVTKQTSRSPEPMNEKLYPNRIIELPDFEGPSSLQSQWRTFHSTVLTLFRLIKLEGCWIFNPNKCELHSVHDGLSLWEAVQPSLPPKPKKLEKSGVSLEDESEEDSEEEEENNLRSTNNHYDSKKIFVQDGCSVFVCGQYEPTSKLIGARHMPSTDDLKTIIVSLSTLPFNPKTTKSACLLLLYLLTEAPRGIIAARSHYVWRSGGLMLLLQATNTFRKDINMIVLCLNCMSQLLNNCSDGCIDTIESSVIPEHLLQFCVDYKISVSKFAPIHAYVASCIGALCNHGGKKGRALFGRRGVDCILSSFRSPALTEELVRCLCQGLASICNDKINSKCVFQPDSSENGSTTFKMSSKMLKQLRTPQANTTFKRGPSYFPQTICRLFVSRDVRNNVEMLYRLIHCCNCILLSAWSKPPPLESIVPDDVAATTAELKDETNDTTNQKRGKWVDVFEGVALENMGESVMAVMKRWEHPQLDTRCVQLLQTIGTVGSDDVRAKLSIAGLPQLLTDEFLEGVETLPTDGCSNLLKAIISTTRGDIAVGECTRLLQVGVLEGVLRVMTKHSTSANLQTAAMNMLEHLGRLPETRWKIFKNNGDIKIMNALDQHCTDRSTVISVMSSFQKIIVTPSTPDDIKITNDIYTKELNEARTIYEEKMIELKKVNLELQREKEKNDFWDVDAKDTTDTDSSNKKLIKLEKEMKPFSFKPLIPAERLFIGDTLTQCLIKALQKNNKDDGVIVSVFQFLENILIALRNNCRGSDGKNQSSFVDDDDVEGSATCEDSHVTKSIGLIVPDIINVLSINKKNVKIIGAGGHLLRRLSLSTNVLHNQCIQAGSIPVMISSFLMDKHCNRPKSIEGILSALSVYVVRQPTPKKKLSEFFQQFLGNEEEDSVKEDDEIELNGFERILEKCCENHQKHVNTVIRSMEIMSMLLITCGHKRILDTNKRTWIRGSVVRVISYMLSIHKENDILLAIACQLLALCMGTPKMSLQILHNGLAETIINGMETMGNANPNVVYGGCRVIYFMAQSRTCRQLLLSKFSNLKGRISLLFGIWAGTNKKVARWGKECMNKLSLPC